MAASSYSGFHMTPETNKLACIEAWAVEVIRHQRIDDFDDLHVDEISEEFRARDTWIAASEQCLELGARLMEQYSGEYAIVVGMSLTANDRPVGIRVDELDALGAELDGSPPSLYVVRRVAPPWADAGQEGCIELTEPFRPRVKGGRAFFCEWWHAADREYRRSVWLTHDPIHTAATSECQGEAI